MNHGKHGKHGRIGVIQARGDPRRLPCFPCFPWLIFLAAAPRAQSHHSTAPGSFFFCFDMMKPMILATAS